MKKIRYIFLAFILSTSFAGMAATENTNARTVERAEQIETRVHEIWKLDFSKMDKVERIVLKEELKAMKKEMKANKGLDSKVSISVGAIIIILLLLILI